MTRVPKVLMIFTEWNLNKYRHKNNKYGGTGYYRVAKPAQILREMYGYDVDVKGRDINDFGSTPEEIWKNIANTYDLIYPRQTDNPRAASDLICVSHHYGRKVLMDMDDNYLSVRPSSPVYEVYKPGSIKRGILGAIMELIDGMTVSTKPLINLYKTKNPRVIQLPNCNDIRDWPWQRKVWGDGKIRIGWAGSTTHNDDLELIVEPAKEILRRYPNVIFEVMGGVYKENVQPFRDAFGEVGDRVEVFYGTFAWDAYPARLNEMGWDIGLAPLDQNDFNVCKSHIKWMEYAMVGIPTIASKVYPYYKRIQRTKTIQNGKTGFLVKSHEDWVRAMEILIIDRQRRLDMAERAYDFIKNNWQWHHHIHKWKKVVDTFV